MVNYHMLLRDYGLPMHDNNCWWVRDSRRALDEIEKMLQNTSCIFYCEGRKLIAEEEIVNNFGSHFLLRIEVDSNFPFAMPKVFIPAADIDHRLGEHIYDDGHLCLLHPDEYRSSMSILDFRKMASAWCFCIEVYKNTGEWPGAEYQH